MIEKLFELDLDATVEAYFNSDNTKMHFIMRVEFVF